MSIPPPTVTIPLIILCCRRHGIGWSICKVDHATHGVELWPLHTISGLQMKKRLEENFVAAKCYGWSQLRLALLWRHLRFQYYQCGCPPINNYTYPFWISAQQYYWRIFHHRRLCLPWPRLSGADRLLHLCWLYFRQCMENKAWWQRWRLEHTIRTGLPGSIARFWRSEQVRCVVSSTGTLYKVQVSASLPTLTNFTGGAQGRYCNTDLENIFWTG